MGGEFPLIPKSPIIGFSARQYQRPHWPAFNELHNVLVRSGPKMRPECLYHGDGLLGCSLEIGCKGKGDKPPRMVVIGTIVISFVELVQP